MHQTRSSAFNSIHFSLIFLLLATSTYAQGNGWRTAVAANGNTVTFDSGPPNGNTIELLKVATIVNFNPIDITFTNMTPYGNRMPVDTFSFFLLQEEVTNRTGRAWSGFRISILDQVGNNPQSVLWNGRLANKGPLDNPNLTNHPDLAHFHITSNFRNTLRQNAFLTTINTTPALDKPDYGFTVLTLSGRPLPSGSTIGFMGLKLHDRLTFANTMANTASNTRFILQEQAIAVSTPESSTLLLFVTFLATGGLAYLSRRRGMIRGKGPSL